MRRTLQTPTNNKSEGINGFPNISRNTYTLEISTEVCNKVGGIYTVLKTKAATFARQFNNHYLLIGPILPDGDYTELDTNFSGTPPELFVETKNILENIGIRVQLGRWRIDGRPWTALLDFQTPLDSKINEELVKGIEQHWDVKRPRKTSNGEESAAVKFYMKFGLLVARFIDVFLAKSAERPETVCLFHEWTSSFALALLDKWSISVPTVFVTHATVLGRRLCESGSDFYQIVDKINAKQEAERLHVPHLHQIEKRVVASADIVATVSSITAVELAKLHGRHADVITPNGLHVASSVVRDSHASNRKKIDEFVRKHFFQNIRFNETKVVYAFSAGRFEFKNKGIDLFIEALSRLNADLIAADADVTLVAFLVFPSRTYDLNEATIKRHRDYEYRRRGITRLTGITDEKALDALMYGGDECLDKRLLVRETANELKEILRHTHYPRDKNPPITTHNMANDNDAIIESLKRKRLLNCYRDRVKVVYHGEFLKSENPLFGMDYQEFVSGCDLGVFASYYEPWGYTPAECHIRGTPAVTSDLSGYGAFLSNIPLDGVEREHMGIYIVERLRTTPGEQANQLTDMLARFIKQSPVKRKLQRENCIRTGRHCDWNTLCRPYFQAMNLALEKRTKSRELRPLHGRKFSLADESVALTLCAKANGRVMAKRAISSAF